LAVRSSVVTIYSTGMRRITKFRSTTDRIYDSGPIRLEYYSIIIYLALCYTCLQYSVQYHAVQVCSLGAIGYTQPRCVVGYTIYVCVSTLYDVRKTTKSPNDAFLRKYPRR